MIYKNHLPTIHTLRIKNSVLTIWFRSNADANSFKNIIKLIVKLQKMSNLPSDSDLNSVILNGVISVGSLLPNPLPSPLLDDPKVDKTKYLLHEPAKLKYQGNIKFPAFKYILPSISSLKYPLSTLVVSKCLQEIEFKRHQTPNESNKNQSQVNLQSTSTPIHANCSINLINTNVQCRKIIETLYIYWPYLYIIIYIFSIYWPT